MIDTVNFRGHFIIQAIDKNNNIIDEYKDDNMIMESARTTMSEIFANLNSNTFINKFIIGTLGHVNDSILIPKGADDGFVKERDRLFSEAYPTTIQIGTTLETIRQNDIFYINATAEENRGYYRFLNSPVTNYTISDVNILLTETWEFLGTTQPYNYSINFTLPQTNIEPTGDLVSDLTEDDSGSGSVVKVHQSDTSVIFTIDVATAAANGETNTSVFTEAALYANDRIFSMKTFKAKVKDSTVLLRIIWTITF